jgi:hypothetical protein
MVPLLYRLYVAVSFTDEQMLGFDPLAKESSTRLQEPIPVHHGEQLVSAARA